MFKGNDSDSLGYSKSPYSLKNPKNPYRGFQGLGAMTTLNPIGTNQETMQLYTRRGQLSGLDGGLGNPALGFSGFLDEVKNYLFSPIGILVLAGGVMVFGHFQGWFGKEKEED